MTRRIVLLAAGIAALAIAAGYLTWQTRVNAVRASFESHVTLAHALISTVPEPSKLERQLAVPELHVIVEDHLNNVVYESENGSVVSRPIPPLFGPEPPPGAGAPGAPNAPRSPIAQLAGSAVGHPPERIEGDGIAVVIAPNVRALGTFLVFDALITFAIVIATVIAAVRIATSFARAARRQLERTLEERQLAAKEFQRFLADAGHELRTPLTIVSGYVEILGAELAQSVRGKQILDGMRAETARMRALVEKMLLLARLESAVSVPRLVDIATVANDVAAQMRARYPDRDLSVHTEETASIVIDQDDLYEALRNLVENALRYAPASPVDIAIAPTETNVSIAVTDRGAGIPADEHERIFERFYRGNEQSDADGSGLGLAIVSRVASRWDGTVDLRSRPGHTVFTLRFPLAEEVSA